MKARVSVQHDANMETCDPKYRSELKPIFRRGPLGNMRCEWFWPVGVVVDGDKAISLVSHGLAEPLDLECAEACGMTAAQVAEATVSQEMAQKGVHSKEDQELYRAGVIKGFKPRADGKPGVEYDWGPNAEAYKAELAKLQTAEAE